MRGDSSCKEDKNQNYREHVGPNDSVVLRWNNMFRVGTKYILKLGKEMSRITFGVRFIPTFMKKLR